MTIPLPVPGRRQSKALFSLEEVQTWATDVDRFNDDVARSFGVISRTLTTLELADKLSSGPIGAHASTHLPATGSDPLATGIGLSITTGNATGTADSFSRSDHTHQGVHTVYKSGGSLLYGDVTLSEGTAVSLTQVGNDIEVGVNTTGADAIYARLDGANMPLLGDWAIGTTRSITGAKNLTLVRGQTDPFAGILMDSSLAFGATGQITIQKSSVNPYTGLVITEIVGGSPRQLAYKNGGLFMSDFSGAGGMTIESTTEYKHEYITYTGTGTFNVGDSLAVQSTTTASGFPAVLRVDYNGTGDRELFSCEANAGPTTGQPFLVTNYGISGTAKIASTSTQRFTGGSGSPGPLDDGTYSGTYSGAAMKRMLVAITIQGTPDSYRYSLNGGDTDNGADIPLTGGGTPQLIADGISIAFTANTGHNVNDRWEIDVTPATKEIWIDGDSALPKITVDNNTAGSNALLFDTVNLVGPVFPYIFMSEGKWRGEIGKSASFSTPISSTGEDPAFKMATFGDASATMQYSTANDYVTFDKGLNVTGDITLSGDLTGFDNLTGAGSGNITGYTYTDLPSLSTPSNPAAGTRRMFTDSGTGELSVRTSAGATVSLESGGGGGGDSFLEWAGL